MKKRYWVPILALTCIWGGYTIYSKPPKSPDHYILTADKIITMDAQTPYAEAVLIEGDLITSVGSLAELEAEADVVVIRKPGILTPGLIEPHTHPIAAALLGAVVDISSVKYSNREDIMNALKEAADKTAITPWLVAYGWDPVALTDLKPPTREELDAISSDRPIFILTQMLHDAYVNTAAIEAAGISLEGSLLHETIAVDSVATKIPAPAPAVTELLVRRQYAEYAKAGFTTIGVTGAVGRHDDPIGLLEKLSTEDHSPLRAFVYLIQRHLDKHSLSSSTDFGILGAKFWMDGSPFTGGAATREPYEENGFVNTHLNIPRGNLHSVLNSSETLIKRIQKLHNQGYQIALHAQGERAIDNALDAIEHIQTVKPTPTLNHRLEHNALITKEQMARAADLGVSLGFFVDHIYYYGHVLPQLFGSNRSNRYMPIKSAIESGAIVTLHGDHPATPVNAVQTLKSATTRASRIGAEKLAPKEAISPSDALKAMTLNAAIQLGQEKTLGSITIGRQADFTLFSGDPLVENLDTIVPLATWKAGQPVDTRAVSWLKPRLIWKAALSFLGL